MTEGRAEEAKAEGIIRAEPLFHLMDVRTIEKQRQ
jgi:hypothetical protein